MLSLYKIVPPPKFCVVNQGRLAEVCQNGGTCVDLPGGLHECLCTDLWTGASCQIGQFYSAAIYI